MTNNKGTGLQWLADIEVNVIAYFSAIIALILSVIAAHLPIIEITAYGYAETYKLSEISELAWMKTTVGVLNLVSVFCLLVPVLKPFEWKHRWFVPVVLTAICEFVGAISLLVMKEKIIKETIIGAMYSLLAIDLEMSLAWAMFTVMSVVVFVCTVVMLKDVIRDERIYGGGE